MIIRWLDPAGGQTYIDNVTEFTLLGVWSWNDSAEVQQQLHNRQCAIDGTPSSELDHVICANVPDYGKIHGTDVLYDLVPRSAWSLHDGEVPLAVFVKFKRGATGDESFARAFLCTWAMLLDDSGNNVDRIAQAARPQRNR